MNIKDFKGKYWHELTQEEVDNIMSAGGISIGELLENLKQPDWCNYPEALSFAFGCWSLCSTTKDGSRNKISKEFCKSCDSFQTLLSLGGFAESNSDVVPSIFAREWKCAKTNPPEEVGRYWCLIEEQNDLGVSYYQWNCSYSKEVGFSKPDHNVIKITHWTELLPCPF